MKLVVRCRSNHHHKSNSLLQQPQPSPPTFRFNNNNPCFIVAIYIIIIIFISCGCGGGYCCNIFPVVSVVVVSAFVISTTTTTTTTTTIPTHTTIQHQRSYYNYYSLTIHSSFVTTKLTSTTTNPFVLLRLQQQQQQQQQQESHRLCHRHLLSLAMSVSTTTTTTNDDDRRIDPVELLTNDDDDDDDNNNNNSQRAAPIRNCAIIGVGVLGTHLLQQIVHANYHYYTSQINNNNNDDRDILQRQYVVTGITKTTNNHDTILQQVLPDDNDDMKAFVQLRTNNNDNYPIQQKYDNIVFCAPPSGFDTDQYATAIQQSMDQYWNHDNGIFVYTSSGAVYGDAAPVTTHQAGTTTGTTGSAASTVTQPPAPYIVTEQTPVADLITNNSTVLRIQRLIQAEQIVLQQNGGCCIRLAGLYNLYRGPHNYWLTCHKDSIASTPTGMVNLLHYEDAANACYQALQLGRKILHQQKVFLISDGHPITRYQICEYAKMASYYKDCTMPQFVGSYNTNHNEAPGKIYDGSYSNHILQWKPKYPSFQQYMINHA